jgi:hypothetical protein
MVEVDWPTSDRRLVQHQSLQVVKWQQTRVKHEDRLPIVVHFTVSIIELARAGSKKKRVSCYANSGWIPKILITVGSKKYSTLPEGPQTSHWAGHHSPVGSTATSLGWTKEAPQIVSRRI